MGQTTKVLSDAWWSESDLSFMDWNSGTADVSVLQSQAIVSNTFKHKVCEISGWSALSALIYSCFNSVDLLAYIQKTTAKWKLNGIALKWPYTQQAYQNSGFQVMGIIKWGKNQNPKKIPRASNKTKKKSHAENDLYSAIIINCS